MNGKMSWMKLVSSCLAAWLLLSACRPLLTPTPAARTGVTPSAVRTQEPSPAQPSPTTADALPTPRATRSEEPLDPPPAPAARGATPIIPFDPTETPTSSATRPATSTPAPTRPAVPSPTPTPTASLLTISERDLGAPGVGDAYGPSDLAVDVKRDLAYVYCIRGPDQRPVLAVIEIAAQRVARLLPLTPLTGQSGGRLLLAPDGAAAFVVDSDIQVLLSLDPLTGKLGQHLDHVRTAALSADGALLITAGEQGLAAYRRADLAEADNPAPLWSQNLARIADLALNGNRILVSRNGDPAQLQVFDAANGQPLAVTALPDSYQNGLAALPDGGWAVRSNGSVSQVQRFTADLQQVVTATVPNGSGLFFDAPRKRLLLSGYRYSAQGSDSSGPILQALDAASLQVQTEQPWQDQAMPEIFAALGASRVLALARYGAANVAILQTSTLQAPTRLIVGVRLLDMALDEASATLFVADDQDRIHRVNLATGRVQKVQRGQAPIALDKINRLLYVNRPATLALLLDKAEPPNSFMLPAGVVALGINDGAAPVIFPQTGVPAPDPSADRVYIAKSGVTIYTRAGGNVGQLKATFPTPQGFSPNPAAYGVLVNPVSGYVLALMNNGVPGSNNSSYVQYFAPGSQQPISVPGYFSFITDIAFAANGDTYISYSINKNQEAIQWLSPTGQERGRLNGLTGRLALDEKGRTLWVSFGASLAAVSMDSLTLQGFWQGPAQVEQLIFDPARRQFYGRVQDRPAVVVVPLSGLAPQETRFRAGAAPTADDLATHTLAFDPAGRWFYVNAGNTVYRTRDGQSWQSVNFSRSFSYGFFTVAAPGVLFRSSAGGADGGAAVQRSRDGGATWELLATGLGDLRSTQPVVATSADVAYFVSRTTGIYAWQAQAGRWQQIMAPENGYSPPGALTLAPDGALFLLGYERMRRSTDRGATWSDVQAPVSGAFLLGFSTDYTVTQTVFAVSGGQSPALMRSTDGGLTWSATGANLKLPSYVYNLKLLVGPGVLYLFRGDEAAGHSELFRSRDNGDTWEAAAAEAVFGARQAVLAADGRLWFTNKSGLQVLAAP